MEDGGIGVDVVSPTITGGSDAGEDGMGTSSTVIWRDGGLEEALVAISSNVVLL